LRIHRLPAVVSRSTVDHAQAVGDDKPQCPSPPDVEATMPDTQKPEDSPTEDAPHPAERPALLFRTAPPTAGSPEPPTSTRAVAHLAGRLALLSRAVPLTADSATLHTSTSVVDALAEQGISVTPNHIRALRTGRRNNPSFRLLAGLADIFRVPLDYFVNDTVA